jgi:hypothetical protein
MPTTSPLGFIVFTAPEKAVVGELRRRLGPPLAWDPTTSTLIFGGRDAALVDTLTTYAADGHMSAQLVRRDRQPCDQPDPHGGTTHHGRPARANPTRHRPPR